MLGPFNPFSQPNQGKANAGDISNFLKNRLGVPLQNKRDESNITAIQTPVTFIQDRNRAINDLLKSDGDLVIYYEKTLAKFIDAGLPAETAQEMAFDSFERMFTNEYRAQELLHPGYEKAFGTAGIGHNATLALADKVTDGDIKGKAHYKAKYQRKKARLTIK